LAFTVTVNYATSNGTATAPADYSATSGSLTFTPGETSKNLNITTVNDAAQEGNEAITLALTSPSNATLGTPNPATLTILDDETPPPPSEEFYTYDTIGNLLSKTGVGAYSSSEVYDE
jgi:Calx-beta domain